MSSRNITPADQLLSEIATALKVVTNPARSRRPHPAGHSDTATLSATDRRRSADLMRINHAGEVSAQALYRGQALTARTPELRRQLLEAADEENDHLAWCEARLGELNSHRSLLSPLWYSGSFAIGALAGLAGDKISLGFLAETENQVSAHLQDHLTRLPTADQRSRQIVSQMRDDEERHSAHAVEQGGEPLPKIVSTAMSLASKIMTGLASKI